MADKARGDFLNPFSTSSGNGRGRETNYSERDRDLAREYVVNRIDVLPNGCWMWNGADDGAGYGVASFTGIDWKQRTTFAHRVSYIGFNGNIPKGFDVDHRHECGIKMCVNPNFLEAVTHAENIRRRYKDVETCKNGHDKIPGQQCKGCNREAQRRFRERHARSKDRLISPPPT